MWANILRNRESHTRVPAEFGVLGSLTAVKILGDLRATFESDAPYRGRTRKISMIRDRRMFHPV